MNSNLPVSACVLVKNEEQHILNCIRSLIPVVNEILIIDTGSTDKTISIASHEDVIILNYTWNDDFSEVRNYAIGVASQPFILMIDADETLNINSYTYLEQYTRSCVKVPATVNIRNVIDENTIVNSVVTRLFPNLSGYCYKGMIHEQLFYDDKPLEQVLPTEIVIDHYGYRKSEIQTKHKIERNLTLLNKQLAIDSNSIYLKYQIGQTYYVNGDYQKAIPYFDDSIRMISVSKFDALPRFMSTVFLSYGYCLLYTLQFDILDNLINDATELYPDFTDLYYLYGVSLIERKDIHNFSSIQDVFEFCIRLGDVKNPLYESVEGVGSYRALFNLGVYFEVTNNVEQAFKYYLQSSEYNFKPAIEKIKRLSM
ncbi:glycosyltransferase family 2 protein [Paenibacillus sp. MDMC362]|uniref:glycosyltransferase family 2 protein n=1 Tax=Paenibacillus sp. MDMC362 TaxID=2977365 RepID=UPI0015ECC331|nr:glycosyltransferase family 2 protein [Paenibacillus sp. MDMC362]